MYTYTYCCNYLKTKFTYIVITYKLSIFLTKQLFCIRIEQKYKRIITSRWPTFMKIDFTYTQKTAKHLSRSIEIKKKCKFTI